MTRKELRDYAKNRDLEIIEMPYASIQHFEKFANRIGYNFGIYGWNWDAYDLGYFIVCTGYRNTIGRKDYANTVACHDQQFGKVVHNLPDYETKKDYFKHYCYDLAKVLNEIS